MSTTNADFNDESTPALCAAEVRMQSIDNVKSQPEPTANHENSLQLNDTNTHAIVSTCIQPCLSKLKENDLNDLVKLIIPLIRKANVFCTKVSDCPKPTNNQKTDKQLQKSNDRLVSMNKGLREQVQVWTTKVKELQAKVHNLESKINNETKIYKADRNKINDFTKTHHKMKNALKELDEKKADVESKICLINEKLDSVTEKTQRPIDDVETSQHFVNSKYEELKKQNEEIKNQLSENVKNFGKSFGEINEQVKELSEGIIFTHEKAENNAQYSRSDSLQLDGTLPESLFDSLKTESENCKDILVKLCKEVNFILNPNSISTAHRLKPRENSKGRGIIVRFINRDARNDVYGLRKSFKDKRDWDMEGVEKVL